MNIDELLESEFMDIIDNHPDKLKELAKNAKFKDKLYKYIENYGVSWSMMRELVSNVGEEEIIENLDLPKMVECSDVSHKDSSYICISALLENGNTILIDKALQDEKIADTFYKDISKTKNLLERVEPSKVKQLFDMAYKKDSQSNVTYELASKLDDDTKQDILNNDYNANVIKSVINSSELDVVQEYLNNNPRALTRYKDLDVLNLAKKGITFPRDITRQKDFFEQIKSNNMVEFRKNVNLVSRDTCSFYLMNKVKLYEENILDGFNEEKGFFSKYDFSDSEMLNQAINSDGKDYLLDYDVQAVAYEYRQLSEKLQNANKTLRDNFNLNIDLSKLLEEDLDSLEDVSLKEKLKKAKEDYDNSYSIIQDTLKKISAEKFAPMLADYTFTDTKNNVEVNTYELLHYNKLKKDNKLLSQENENIYNKFNNLDKLSAKEQYELYKETKEKNMTSQLYTDIANAKNEIYKDICDSLYNVDNEVDDISVEDSERTGTEYHKLDGKDFYMLVRVLDSPYNEKTKNPQSCYTLISSKNLNVFSGKYVYYYGKVDPKRIINTFESDSYTNADSNNLTDRANRLSTKEDLVETSASYSEINIANESFTDKNGKTYYKELKPDGLLTFNEPNEETIVENKRINGKLAEIVKERYKQEIRQEDKKEDKRYDYNINPYER